LKVSSVDASRLCSVWYALPLRRWARQRAKEVPAAGREPELRGSTGSRAICHRGCDSLRSFVALGRTAFRLCGASRAELALREWRFLLRRALTPKRPSCAPGEGCPREPIHHVESAIEQCDRQRDPFCWRQGLNVPHVAAIRLRIDRPSMRGHSSWHGLHHRPPRDMLLGC
jgi:hypothetical protein